MLPDSKTAMSQGERKRGRPPGTTKPADERAESQLQIRVRREDKARWVKQAQREGMKLSEWVIAKLNA